MTPEIEQLIHQVLHGRADEADCQRLSAWITQSDDNARAYCRVAMDERAIRVGLERESSRSLESLAYSPDDSGAGMILAELARAEANAHAPLVELIDLRTTWWQDHAKTLAVAAGIALAVLVAVVVTLTVDPSANETSAPMSQDRQSPSVVPAERVVQGIATLTAERGAVWQGVAGQTLPVVGEPLTAGQRLSLSRGMIEITTQRGAIAIVQAPCTVQVIGSNALALEHGKLLGICESESSKGFVVHTPLMDVTDLGTRFGIDATDTDATQVHVLEGKVRATRSSGVGVSAAPQTLLAGQAVVAQTDRGDLQAVEAAPERFASITPQRIELFGTGRGLAMGDTDSKWRVTAADGRRLTTPEFMVVGGAPSGGTEGIPSGDAATSQWLIGNYIDVTRSGKEARFTCRTRFDLPAGIDPESARLVLHFDADERIDEVRINGRAITPDPHSYTDDHVELNTLVIPGSFIKDSNTLELDVIDLVRGSGTKWGLRVQARLEMLNTSAP